MTLVGAVSLPQPDERKVTIFFRYIAVLPLLYKNIFCRFNVIQFWTSNLDLLEFVIVYLNLLNIIYLSNQNVALCTKSLEIL